MSYHVVLTASAKKILTKLDKHTASLLVGWMRKNLEGCSDPRRYGKALTANQSGQWRYRMGDYRLIAEIEDDKVVILIVDIGHRREIYD